MRLQLLAAFLAHRSERKKPGRSRAKAPAMKQGGGALAGAGGIHAERRFSRVLKYRAILPIVSVRPNLVWREAIRFRVFGCTPTFSDTSLRSALSSGAN